MRNLLLAAAAAVAISVPAHAIVVLDTGGFEGYAPGAIQGQNGWYTPASGQYNGYPVSSPTISGGPLFVAPNGAGNKVLEFNCFNRETNRTAIDFADQVGVNRYVKASFDFFREGTGTKNVFTFWPQGNNPLWGQIGDPNGTGKLHPFQNVGSADLAPDGWQNVLLQWDLTTGTGNAWLNGVQVSFDENLGSIGQFNGLFLEDSNPFGAELGHKAYLDNLKIVASNDLGAIPEPGTLALLAGALPLVAIRRRRK